MRSAERGESNSGLFARQSLPAWAFSLAFVTAVIVGRHVVFSGLIDGGLALNYMTQLAWADVLLIGLLVPPAATLTWLLARATGHAARTRADAPRPHQGSRHAWVVVALVLLIAWTPYVLTYAPGTVMPDSLYSIAGDRTNHHPILFTAVVSTFARYGEARGDITGGVFAYTVLQTVVIAVLLGMAVGFVARRGAPRWWTISATAYFALVPVFPIYAINVQKDPLFSVFVLMMSLMLYRVAESNGELLRKPRGIGLFCASAALVIFFRNNGVFVVLGALAGLLVLYRRGFSWFYAAAVGLLIATVVIQWPVYDALQIRRNTFVESIGIPLQQVAYVITTDGKVTPTQREYLNGLMPYEEWSEAYAPCLVDTIKWSPDFDGAYLNADRQRFMRTWAELLRRNPGAYAKAYCLATMGFWRIGVNSAYGFADTGVVANTLGIESVDWFRRLTGTSLKPLLDATRGSTGTGSFVSASVLSWAVLFLAALTALGRDRRVVLALVPLLALWGSVMVFTPVAFSLRYVFALALCLPGALLLPFVSAGDVR